MAIKPFGKEKPYENRKHKAELPVLLEIVRANKYNKPGTDVVFIEGNKKNLIYVIDHSADSEIQNNIDEGGDGFGIRNTFKLNKLTENDIQYITRNIAGDYRGSKELIQHRLQELGITTEKLPGIDIDAAIQRGIRDYGEMVDKAGEEGLQTNTDRSSIDSRENQGVFSEIVKL